jgi:hypothetical protein
MKTKKNTTYAQDCYRWIEIDFFFTTPWWLYDELTETSYNWFVHDTIPV